MNTFQIAKTEGNAKPVYITGALTYMEAVKKLNSFVRSETSEEVSYSVELFMPNRPVQAAAPAQQEEPAESPIDYLNRIYSVEGYSASASLLEANTYLVEMYNGETEIAWEVSCTPFQQRYLTHRVRIVY